VEREEEMKETEIENMTVENNVKKITIQNVLEKNFHGRVSEVMTFLKYQNEIERLQVQLFSLIW
jgi:hypothetical protein